jgi:hypothetical protein
VIADRSGSSLSLGHCQNVCMEVQGNIKSKRLKDNMVR